MNPKIELVQCAANFSEGRRESVIKSIVQGMSQTPGATVIDYSSDIDHNRSVITVLGDPSSVVESALSGVQKAVELIDLRTHQGQHPRIGAADVIPFTPLFGTSMDVCIEKSKILAKRIGEELGVPVYLYEQSATDSNHKALPDIRRGGFEALQGITLDGERSPDFGPNQIHPSAGVCVVGARSPLVAFNVNLHTTDLRIAKRIAKAVRGRTGGLVGVRSLGLDLQSRGMVQVSLNIIRPDLVPLYRIFEMIKMEALGYGITISESEVIGAIPLSTALDTVSHYLQISDLKENQILERWSPKKVG